METIDEIVADIREQNLGMPDDMECVSPLVCDMLRLADRIEKSARHEMSDEFSAEIQKLTDELYEVKKANASLKAALVASNDELNLARSNSRSMYKRLNDENLRITEMDRETIHGLRAENERLKAALQPVLEVELNQVNGHPCADGDYCTSSEYGVCDNDGNEIDNESIADALSAVNEAQRIWKEGEK